MQKAIHSRSLPLMLTLLAALAVAFFFLHPQRAASDTSVAITGYAWSDTVGWISMTGSTYGLTVNSGGVVSGYAWSDTIGWVSANSTDLSGCPNSACTAKIQNGNLTGWLKALAGGTAGSGGWDGWISLSGTSPAYGVVLNETTGNFSGFSWGSTGVGWMDWQYAHSTFTEVPPCQNTQGNFCSGNEVKKRDSQCNETSYSPPSICSYQCSAGACVAPPSPQGNLSDGSGNAIEVTPSIVPTGKKTTVTWNILNVTACSVSGSDGEGPWSGASGSHQSSGITKQTTFTLSCTDLGGSPFKASATVNVIPVFREI